MKGDLGGRGRRMKGERGGIKGEGGREREAMYFYGNPHWWGGVAVTFPYWMSFPYKYYAYVSYVNRLVR